MSRRALNSAENAELEQLRARYLKIIDFLGTHGLIHAGVVMMRDMIEQIYQERDLLELRALRRDFSEMIRSMNSEDQRTLGAILKSFDGTNLVEDRRRDCMALKAIEGRRRIDSDEEFRFVMAFVSDVDGECDPAVDRGVLSQLLLEYEERLRVLN